MTFLRPRHLERLLACATTLAVSAGCVHYEARPLTPDATLARLNGRRLDDPALARAAASALGVSAWPPARWDLDVLTVVGLHFHPDLAVARASWGAAQAARVTAGARPDPTVIPGPGYNASTPASTVTPWILNLALDITIETGGKRAARVARAGYMSDSARFAVADAAWRLRSTIRQALLDHFAATEAAALLERQGTIQQSNLSLFQRQLDAGEISAFQLAQARLQSDAIRIALADARRQREDARARIATAVGVPLASMDGAAIDATRFMALPAALPEAAARERALVNRADVLGAVAAYEATQATLQLEVARQYPDIHLGPGYQMDQNSHKWTLLFPMTPPIFSRNRGPIAEANARRLEAAAQVDAVQARALGALDRATVTYREALAKVALADQLIADLTRATATARQQFAVGAISRLDLGVVELELTTRELTRLDAVIQAQQALGALEDAMQLPANIPTLPERHP